MPPVHTIVGELAQAVVDVENHPFRDSLPSRYGRCWIYLGDIPDSLIRYFLRTYGVWSRYLTEYAVHPAVNSTR